jgi:hypothetical protein
MTDWHRVMELSAEERVPIYREHLERKPSDADIWFDLGLAYKALRQWKECAAANVSALDLSAEPGDPAWWNLGIAATALRDWRTARRAWRGYGIDGIANGDEPIEANYGYTPVRLPHGEVVWGVRVDPARVKIESIPFPEHGFRWGDIVLHDGAPNGERVAGDRTYNVFDVFERWSPSEIATLIADTECKTDDDARALVDLFEQHHFAAEDWTTGVRSLCRACSNGRSDAHRHSTVPSGNARSFGIACPFGLANDLLAQWVASSPGSRSFVWAGSNDAD